MGCSSSKTTSTTPEQFPTYPRPFQTTYEGRKSLYTFLHSKCDSSLFSKILGDEIFTIQNSIYSTYQSQVDHLFLHYKSQILPYEISQTEFYSLTYDHITTSILDNYFLTSNLNIFNKLKLLFAFMFPEQETEADDEYNEDDDDEQHTYITKYQRSIQTLQLFEKTIPPSLTAITYYLKGKLNELEHNTLKGLNRNIKFNTKYQPEMLTLVLTPFMLENKALINDIAELIAKGDDHLCIVNIFINLVDVNEQPITNCNLNFADQERMYTLLESVNQNKKIKVLMIQCISNGGNSSVVLAPENLTLIIKKLQSETLNAFHLGGFTFSNDFIHSLCFQLMSTRSLTVFSLDYVGIGECLLDKILPALMRNTSLSCVNFSGFDIEAYGVDIEEVKMKIKEKNNNNNNNSKLCLMVFNRKCIVGYPFEPVILDE